MQKEWLKDGWILPHQTDASLEILNGEFLFLWLATKKKCSMFGLKHLLDIFRSRPNF